MSTLNNNIIMHFTHHRLYRYRLGRTTARCPQCGRKRFKLYERTSDGTQLDASCGRCNREHSCGYHLPPSEFFARRGYSDISALAARPHQAARPQQRGCDFVAESVVQATLARDPAGEPVHALLARSFGPATAAAVAADYRFACGRLHSRTAALYWLTDRCGRTRSGKLMLYGPDARRLRHTPYAATAYVHPMLRHGFRFEACYFGAHLLPRHPQAEVLLVESEKTALYMACLLRSRGLWGRVLPLATGGCSALAPDPARLTDPFYRLSDLRSRSLLLAPDADAAERWNASAPALRRLPARVRVLGGLASLAATPADDIMDIALRSP
ncbi:MAG: hypothetical protein K2F77_05010, partial [Muribaculaceae bacterium]|nr:hypothetical protein [Muribaculaceae bacterium]